MRILHDFEIIPALSAKLKIQRDFMLASLSFHR